MGPLPFVTEYKGYELHCTPERIDDGRYAARLLICRQHGEERDEIALPMPASLFDTGWKAALTACEKGKHWVDENG